MSIFTKENKREINVLLNKHNIKDKKQVFDAINQGKSREAIDAMLSLLIQESKDNKKPLIELLNNPQEFAVFGQHLIAQNTLDDMSAIMRLPYVLEGALMPDGHRVLENHVPVGGVVLSEGIIPGIVGADISCSVLLTITSQPVDEMWFDDHLPSLKYTLQNDSYFGQEINPKAQIWKNVLDDTLPLETELGKQLFTTVKNMAGTQFGTSGDGNHFVEFGLVNVAPSGMLQQSRLKHLAVLSHFGSRGIGAQIAKAFEAEANNLCVMPKGMHDAMLDISTPLGKDYWTLMQWAGQFAEQGHRWLHEHLFNQLANRIDLDYSYSQTIYSRHNFAWSTPDGYVHRKGATPAEFGEYGVIPATMGDATQIVLGMGNVHSFFSASHGAGRTHSRGSAIQAFGKDDTAQWLLKNHGVHLIGGGADEDPRAYKLIDNVMEAQRNCCTSIGTFQPKVVRMAPPRFRW